MSDTIIAAIDIGTTLVKCQLIDKSGKVLCNASENVELIYPKPGFVEIDPENLWNSTISAVKNAVTISGLSFNNITCIGISSQRCSFLTWNRRTGRNYHKFITWKDIRADSMVHNLNNSIKIRILRLGAKFMHLITRNKRYLAGSVIKFMNSQVTVRLMWILNEYPQIYDDAEKGDVAFGTVDTWILYKLSGGQLHISDYSCASATGLFDPFTMSWADWAFKLFNIPLSIFPQVVDTAGKHFGFVSEDIFGVKIPILCSISDQSAALFGSCCFNVGDLKVTMGTGTFLNVNTGKYPHASVAGMYPVIGWKYNDEIVYSAEGASNDTGALIQWALRAGLIKNAKDSSQIALSVEDNNGVYFIPSFNGIQAPVNNAKAAAGFIGIKPMTKKEHLMRAILESITFRIIQLLETFKSETVYSTDLIRIDGGVSQNDFIAQLLADISKLPVARSHSTEMSSFGAAYFAGIVSGIWKDKYSLNDLCRTTRTFTPNKENNKNYVPEYEKWKKAIKCFYDWYD